MVFICCARAPVSLSLAWGYIATNKALADAYAANVLPVIRELRRAGATSLHQIAKALNAAGMLRRRQCHGNSSSMRLAE
jgi:hypothetical protein